MAKYVCVCMVCMNAICTGKQMDFPIGLPKLASLLAHGFILKFWATVIGRCGMTQVDVYKVKDLCMYMAVLSTKK
jgi:hypothetical protein